MLGVFIFPLLIGGIHWLIHKSAERNDERATYERRKVFGITLLLVIAINILGLIAIASSSENPEAGRIAGRQFAWLIIAGFAGQGWIRSIWEPYEKNMRHGKSLLTGLKFGSAAKATVSSERDTPGQINDYQPKAVSGFTGLKFGSSAKKQLDNKSDHSPGPAKAPEPLWLEGSETTNKEKPLDQQASLEPKTFESNSLDLQEIQVNSPQDATEARTEEKSSNNNLESELIRLKDFYDRGLIDDQEYSKLKQKLLDI